MAFFCTQTGARIVAPGVSKEVDSVAGQELYREPEAEPTKKEPEKPAKKAKE